MDTDTKVAAAIGLFTLIVLMIIFGPLFAIWSWNQLFGALMIIEYNFWNWLAAIGLGMFFRGVRIEKDKK
jgi:hypothetical protein